jgi:gas vesicle protein
MDNTEDRGTNKKTRGKSDGNTLAVVGVALGAAIGAAIALVYSRGTGEQNRANLNKWAHNRLDDVQRKVDRPTTA